MKLNNILEEEFSAEMNTTLRVFEGLSNDMFDYKSHEKSMSVAELVNHMLQIPSWVGGILSKSELNWATHTPQEAVTTKEDLIAAFKVNVSNASEALKNTDEVALENEWSMKKGDVTFFTAPKRTVMRNLVINHTIHHRAQLGLNLRLNNLAVPASYGASADESLFS